MNWTVHGLRREIALGRRTRVSVIEQVLHAATDPSGVGRRAFLALYADQARCLAESQDAGESPAGPLSGIPVSIKDLFDVEGEVTTAGSRAQSNDIPAAKDAPAVRRLKQAGAILIGRTHMTEFAFSGIGLNAHFDVPPNPYDRVLGRIPGGSSSGAAVSVSDGMAVAALGSDTGGSVRIPAALCGLTGFKPTKSEISTKGMFPLSPTLDSVGVIANSVRCCHAVYEVLCEEKSTPLEMRPAGIRTFTVPMDFFTDDMDATVASGFDRTLSLLSSSGARLIGVKTPELEAIRQVNARGGIAAGEAFRFHQKLGLDMVNYDPRVRERIMLGERISDNELTEMKNERDAAIVSFARRDHRDGFLCPTVPIIAPPISTLDDDSEFFRVNRLLLRNPSFANFLDLCAVSLPCHIPGDAPVGLSLMGLAGTDVSLLSNALGIEQVIRPQELAPEVGFGTS